LSTTNPRSGQTWGLALGQAGLSVLQRLQTAGRLGELLLAASIAPEHWQSQGLARVQQATTSTSLAELVAERWPGGGALVAVGACGAVLRLVAPLLQHKDTDPAVLVIDPGGRYVLPILGGHGGGGEDLAAELAALLGASAVITGSSHHQGRLALDHFGEAWGWRRGQGDWTALMQQAATSPDPLLVHQSGGVELWQGLDASTAIELAHPEAQPPAQLWIGPELGNGAKGQGHWHPPCLWLGVGCERDTSLALIESLITRTLASHGLAEQAVAGLASIDRKGDEPALLALAADRGWPLKLFGSEALAAQPVPNPSAAVAREMGTASVAEAAALLAAGPGGVLQLAKVIAHAQAPEHRGAATLAVAQMQGQWQPASGSLHLIGSGPGALELLTGDARSALSRCNVWVGYGLYLDLLEPLRRPDQLRLDGRLTEERERCRQALDLARQGLNVALISSGDSGIYGMAGLALEQWMALEPIEQPEFTVHPGLSALQLAAARAGAPLMHDFCTISLSDRLTPWPVIEKRLAAAASGDFVVALYNPRSLGRDWQLGRARELLLTGRSPETPVVLARQLGRPEEEVRFTTLGALPLESVDMLTLVLVGNSSSRIAAGKMVTPRGYPGAELA
jgi:cobalt-precorrin 5A hydrolase/precorrin-3B C17-methyltransferase